MIPPWTWYPSHCQHSVRTLGANSSGISGVDLFKLPLTKRFLFGGFFTTLSLSSQYTRMVQWLINNDLKWIWKDAVLAEVLFRHTRDAPRKTTRNLSQNSRCRRQELNGASPEQKRTTVRLHDSVVSTLSLYVGGPWFRPRNRDRLFWQVFLLPSFPPPTARPVHRQYLNQATSVSVRMLPSTSLTNNPTFPRYGERHYVRLKWIQCVNF
jgi:hypothetical protein